MTSDLLFCPGPTDTCERCCFLDESKHNRVFLQTLSSMKEGSDALKQLQKDYNLDAERCVDFDLSSFRVSFSPSQRSLGWV